MSAGNLIELLSEMDRLHGRLLALGEKKTDIIKKNEIDKLNQLLKDEQKYAAAARTLEMKRQQASAQITGKWGASLADCIESVPEAEREPLRQWQQVLMEKLERLKELNELNQQLLRQSLQFINMSMSTVQPSPVQATYTHPARSEETLPKRSMFDSQA
ncbi:flagellar protein FlgN [Bacillus thermotolerans]|uniref:Flagellar protein FlgN n=1 Tax=Bacillus thermotolerans TaxID=1221996 RepID=A0A0F5I6S2_BACTR|nr:flagellar protein FlgN [Bacillus thermotolerans]KKB41133.1 hypothetical protein QY95_00840 [Bacillus thermotolerans]KKB42996.1 hypothetical protein QY96_01163 [Bacillus thermotolerans]